MSQRARRAGASGRERWQARALTRPAVVTGLTVALFLVPSLLDLLSDERRPYGYVAPDAFYFFTIAVNWVKFGIPTYDQQFPTNGFHPLWQWLVTALFKIVSWLGHSRLALVSLSVAVGLVCISAALILLGQVMRRGHRLSPWFLLLPVGSFALCISPWWWNARDQAMPLFGTLWCFANGMESAITILMFAVVAWLYVRRPIASPRGALVFGTALGLMTLARLDHAVFAVVMLSALLFEAALERNFFRIRLTAFAVIAWCACLAGYLFYNKVTVGRFMPLSGAIKSTFPSVTTSSIDALLSFRTLGQRSKLYHLGRIGSLVASAVVALYYILFAVKLKIRREGLSFCLRDDDRIGRLLLMTSIGTLLLSTYDALFVINMHIGQWYAPVSILSTSLIVVRLADPIELDGPSRFAPFARVGIVVALASMTLAYFWHLQRVLPWGGMYADFCLDQARRLAAHYGSAPPKIISNDDGVVAFGSGFPTTAGTLLALDPAAHDALRTAHFATLLEARGIRRITVLNYHLGWLASQNERGSDELRTYAASVLRDRSDMPTIETEYSDGSFAILRVQPSQ
jgi:hypothetical protein